MKRMDLLCASPASTAICSSLDQQSVVRHGPRTIDHKHKPSPQHRFTRNQTHVPCSSKLPLTPRPYWDKSRSQRSSNVNVAKLSNHDLGRRKSSADTYDLKSPPGSSRYLLNEEKLVEWLAEPDRPSALVPVPAEPVAEPKDCHSISNNGSAVFEPKQRQLVLQKESPVFELKQHQLIANDDSPSPKSSHSARSRRQVVVLRVSLHCRGCESKLRKHLSKMEGVTSYSIDMEDKKVTIIGDVTPLGVLSSVLKVKKYAQLWPSSSSTSSSSPSSSWST